MEQRRERLVVAIGILRLLKAGLLAALGVAGLVDMPEDVARVAERAITWMGVRPGHEVVQHALGRLASMEPRTMHRLGVASFCYAAVFLVEGIGLVLRKTWAEWLTVVVTASFIPIEVYELARRGGVGKAITLALNVAIAAYLAWRRIRALRSGARRRREPRPAPALAPEPRRA